MNVQATPAGIRATALMLAVCALVSCQQAAEEAAPPAPTEPAPVASPPAASAASEHVLAEPPPPPGPPVSPFRNLETMDFEAFEAVVYKVPGTRELYVVNGDVTILGRRNLEEFFKRAKGDAAGVVHGKLLVNRLGALAGSFSGRPDVWDPELRKRLTYCVSEDFGDDLERVASAMDAAASDWERHADVAFGHAASASVDCRPDGDGIVFAVVPASMDAAVLASAPFPHFPVHERILRINDFFLRPGGDQFVSLEGLLRHEIGHVLGFDHEQNRPEAGSCFVPDDNFAATPFDPRSVMMYPECQREGEFSGFALSELDKRGAGCLYGPGPESPANDPNCNYRAATSNATGNLVTTEWVGERIAKGEWRYYDPMKALPGSIVTIGLQRDVSEGGDPDLYLRFLDRPSSREFDCGPRLDADVETCRVRIPDRTDGRRWTNLHIGVRGVSDATYRLDVAHVAAEQQP